VDLTIDIIGWIITSVLMIIGLIGAVAPMLPGTAIIMGAAVIHYFVVGADQSPGWVGYIILALLLILSYVLEFLASSAGAKKFGSTKAGIYGALVGGFVGIFFGLPGLILGPVLGAFLAETVIAKQTLKKSANASHGAFWGVIVGSLIKVVCAFIMICTFFIDALWL